MRRHLKAGHCESHSSRRCLIELQVGNTLEVRAVSRDDGQIIVGRCRGNKNVCVTDNLARPPQVTSDLRKSPHGCAIQSDHISYPQEAAKCRFVACSILTKQNALVDFSVCDETNTEPVNSKSRKQLGSYFSPLQIVNDVIRVNKELQSSGGGRDEMARLAYTDSRNLSVSTSSQPPAEARNASKSALDLRRFFLIGRAAGIRTARSSFALRSRRGCPVLQTSSTRRRSSGRSVMSIA